MAKQRGGSIDDGDLQQEKTTNPILEPTSPLITIVTITQRRLTRAIWEEVEVPDICDAGQPDVLPQLEVEAQKTTNVDCQWTVSN